MLFIFRFKQQIYSVQFISCVIIHYSKFVSYFFDPIITTGYGACDVSGVGVMRGGAE